MHKSTCQRNRRRYDKDCLFADIVQKMVIQCTVSASMLTVACRQCVGNLSADS